jgi:hypothetical protein
VHAAVVRDGFTVQAHIRFAQPVMHIADSQRAGRVGADFGRHDARQHARVRAQVVGREVRLEVETPTLPAAA